MVDKNIEKESKKDINRNKQNDDNLIESKTETTHAQHTHKHHDDSEQVQHTHKHQDELEQTQHMHEYQDESEHMQHMHKHHHEDTKKVINRMSRAIGHMEAIKRMIEDDRDCSEVLIQIAAVKSAINNVGKMILQDHINHCVVDALETGDQKVLDDLADAIDKFVK